MRMIALLALGAMLPFSSLAQLTSNTMMRLRINNVVSGLDATEVITVYRMGGQYGRVERQPKQPAQTGDTSIVSEPDVWMIHAGERKGQHMVDTDPDGTFKMQILPAEPLAGLEFGTEFDFFASKAGVRKSKIIKQDKAYDRYSLVIDKMTLTMLSDLDQQRPRRITVLYDGTTVADFVYLEYKVGLAADMALFRPPPGLELAEMTPEGLEDKASPFPLAHALPRRFPESKADLQQLRAKWDVFQHEPYDVSGICHLTLPFQYATSAGGDTNEANAFAFLLSNSLDWYPGCYCARHAYFVFKRTGKDIVDAGSTLNQSLIVKLAQRWNATHVIAGTLMHGTNGYGAKIRVFDHDGRSIYEKSYEPGYDYFELLGNVSVGIMQSLDYKPLPGLVAHLKMKRCANPQSLIDLGKAAFAEERSDYEFGLYNTILERDPGFADVRFWLANQRYWKDDNRASYNQDMQRAAGSYLVEAVVEDRMPKDPNTLARVKALVGGESPLAVLMELGSKAGTNGVSAELIDRGIRTAEKYPNNRNLLLTLAAVFEKDGEGLADCDMIVSLLMASMESRFMAGSAAQTRLVVGRMAEAMMTLGRSEQAAIMEQGCIASAMEDQDVKATGRSALELGDAMRQMGLFSEAYKVHLQALKLADDPAARGPHVARACVLAALMGEKEKVAALQAEYPQEVARSGWQPIINAYVSIIDKKDIGPGSAEMLKQSGRLQREAVLLLAQADIAAKKTNCRAKCDEYMASYPDDRELWIVCDAYNQIAASDHAGSFYTSLELLHGEDPWVQDAARRYRERGGKDGKANPNEIATRLSDCEPTRWPMLAGDGRKDGIPDKGIPVADLTVAVDALLKEGQKQKARELVLRYQYYVANLRDSWVSTDRQYALRARCNHLYHLIERAKEGCGLAAN